jgi:hypothetical protein
VVGPAGPAVATSGLPLERGGSSDVGRGRAGRLGSSNLWFTVGTWW